MKQRFGASLLGVLGALAIAAGVPASEPLPQHVILRGVTFAFGSPRLEDGSAAVLEFAAEHLRRNPGLRLRIVGHTSSAGPADYNRRLSQWRAEAVRDALVELGVESERLVPVGRGEAEPIASNRSREGRALNRRVELIWLDPEPPTLSRVSR